MAETNYSVDVDLKEAGAMARALVPYVYEDELYAKLGGRLPSLTLGALLMRLRRLTASSDSLKPDQRALLREIQRQHDDVRREWRQHYIAKLKQEALSRLKAMGAYFAECTDDPKLCANAYLPEALRRTIAQDILYTLRDLEVETDEVERAMRQADSKLRGVVKPSTFVWAPALQPFYPNDDYWWLYARPPQPDKDG